MIATACALAGLLAAAIWLAVVSREFLPGAELAQLPVVSIVATSVVAGLVYLVTVRRLSMTPPRRGVLAGVLFVGALCRAVMFGSVPILEDDAYRYLWDGAAVAAGRNPYAHAPGESRDGRAGEVPSRALAEAERTTLDRVNHPSLRTIYPPVAQAAFGLGHVLAPWSLDGLRAVWAALDVAVLAVLAWTMRHSPARTWRVAVYWLNPVLVRQVYNACHMELLVVAFGAVAVVLAGARRPVRAAFALALAAGAKLWPVLWVPLVLRSAQSRRDAVHTVIVATLSTGATVIPMLFASMGAASGLGAYAVSWRMNDSAFAVLDWVVRALAPKSTAVVSRIVCGTIVGAVGLFVAVRPLSSAADLERRALVVVAVLFLLSPTQFPWYYLWLLPVLALRPRWSLLSLTVTLPLYDLRFLFAAAGSLGQFDYGVVWLEFLPIWGLLVLEWIGCVPLPSLGSEEVEVWRTSAPSS